MAQAVSRRPLNSEVPVRCQTSQCEICGGQSSTGSDFCPNTTGFPCIIPLRVIYHFYLKNCHDQKDEWTNSGNLHKNNAGSEIDKHLRILA